MLKTSESKPGILRLNLSALAGNPSPCKNNENIKKTSKNKKQAPKKGKKNYPQRPSRKAKNVRTKTKPGISSSRCLHLLVVLQARLRQLRSEGLLGVAGCRWVKPTKNTSEHTIKQDKKPSNKVEKTRCIKMYPRMYLLESMFQTVSLVDISGSQTLDL